MVKTFYYTNTLGYHKMLDIQDIPNAEGKYHCILWNADNGELCGASNLTLEEIKKYFKDNHIDGTFNG